jgi:hypothetical protein
VSINKPVELNVVVVLAERIDQHFGDFQPSDVEAKLQQYVDERGFKNLREINAGRLPSIITCNVVKNGKYMSGSSYFPGFLDWCSTNCLPSKAEKKYAYSDSVTTCKHTEEL